MSRRVVHRKGLPSFPSIDRDALRDHGDPARIERVWERIEHNLALEPKATPRKAPSRWPFVSTALAAGFALGVGVSGWLLVDEEPAPLVMQPAETETAVEVFAAGTAPRSYPLAGGGLITVEPGSIVDTVSRDGDRLTLRLVRGEATLSTAPSSPSGAGATARGTRVALLVGGAEVTPSGQMRIRHDGDTAYLRVLDGSASVNAPDTGSGAREMVLGPDQEATVPVRVVTASLDPARVAPRSVDEQAEEVASTSPEESAEESAVVAVAAKPDWEKACEAGDDETAAKLFAEEGRDLGAIGDASLVACVSVGREMLKDYDGAIASYERLVSQFEQQDPARAMTAAYALAGLYDKLGQRDKATRYRLKGQELSNGISKGMLLTERGLCEKIQAEAAAGNGEPVRELGRQYAQQFPDGPCTEIVDKLLAAHALPEPAPARAEEDDEAEDGDPDAPAEPDPYEEGTSSE